MSDDFNPITRWRCTRCQRWVLEPIARICRWCRETDGVEQEKTLKHMVDFTSEPPTEAIRGGVKKQYKWTKLVDWPGDIDGTKTKTGRE